MMTRSEARGRFTMEDGIEWFRIDDVDRLDPFLVTVVTADDQWIYVSTSGALAAGRGRADQTLFPYETDDRLHRSGGRTGPVTMIRATTGDMIRATTGELWEPLAPHHPGAGISRSLAKTAVGDRLRFEEYHQGLGLRFSYTWSTAGPYGLVRTCELSLDQGRPATTVDLLDGLVDVLPAGVELATQQTSSTLVDAYRRSELDPETGLALFTLEALISDQPDPAESLRANTIWWRGLDGATVALSDRQVPGFRRGRPIEAEHLVTGTKGALVLATTVSVTADQPVRWVMAAEVAQDHRDLVRLRRRLVGGADLGDELAGAMDDAHHRLSAIVDRADGVQASADRPAAVHHFANVMFNLMRGGTFLDDHRIEVADLDRFVARHNRALHPRFQAATADLAPMVELDTLRQAVAHDPHLRRLTNQYLPVSFARRHGDPSRPWNHFHIPRPDLDGRPARGFEGNWRDIFQNWEALGHSYPAYLESMVATFLNASTLDGHNPYRITSDGLDWEVPEEGSWANFGYWGDHQIVYLHRLLDATIRHHPGRLESMLDQCHFSYADTPYRIVPYDEVVADPKRTLVFDQGHHDLIQARRATIGADGALIPAPDGEAGQQVHLASLTEKLLVPALAKLSNLVAGGGIWMNTQRPEWNDANNALVGNGVSVVTLFHLRHYLHTIDGLLARSPVDQVPLAGPVTEWLGRLQAGFEAHHRLAEPGSLTATGRRHLLDTLGQAFSHYRATVYADGPGSNAPVSVDDLRRFLAVVGPHLDAAADAARRPDRLFHTYWLLALEPGTADLEPLPPMLEGQVAALSSGVAGAEVDARATVEVVDALFASDLYRPDQQSFVLYPDRRPPPFLDKNRVPEDLVGPALEALVDQERIVGRDQDGTVRFHPELVSARHLAQALDEQEKEADTPLPGGGRAEVLAAYEAVFRHRAFTGRSQTMYRYEGLGSIYWHMVSKLVLAVQDNLAAAIDRGEDEGVVTALAERHHRLLQGLGYRKTVVEQGSFPTDPHSHTPAHAGAQQPGMTGQVKEGVLLRWGALGVRVDQGRIRFAPVVLDPAEALTEAQPWPRLGSGRSLEPGSLGFTYCGVPVVYHLGPAGPGADGGPGAGSGAGSAPWVEVTWAPDGKDDGVGPDGKDDGVGPDGKDDGVGPDGKVQRFDGSSLDREASRALLARTGRIDRIDVGVDGARLRRPASAQ